MARRNAKFHQAHMWLPGWPLNTISMISNKTKGLGEVVLRVRDMEKMRHFYSEILGLEVMRADEKYTFLKIAEGYKGHTQILALFHPENPTAFDEILDEVDSQRSALHHLALEIDNWDYSSLLHELNEKGLEVRTEYFTWVQWKSIFIKDPENNIIEFVCYAPD